MGRIRYVLFGAVGIVVAAVLFVALSWLIGPHFEAGTDYIEGWIIRATCDNYALAGTVRDPDGAPIAFATLEATFTDQRITTRSGPDGRFALTGATQVCEPKPTVVTVAVSADGYVATSNVLGFGSARFNFMLERSKAVIDFNALGTRP